jgi:DNA-binding PadR family transcriptional regulator
MRSRQTRTAVLGALSIQPMTGYAVREAIRETLGHFWSESFGQIYPALAELEQESLVERRGGTRTGSSAFALTPAGHAHLRTLLTEPPQPGAPRNGTLLRLFFGRTLGPQACADLVRDARDRARSQLTALAAARTDPDHGEHTDDSPYWLLTISAGEHAARATIVWADEALATLATLGADDHGAAHPSPTSTKDVR